MPRAHVVPNGAKIAALRGEADITQWELAREAGYGLRTIGKIEGGRPTGAKTLSAAATVLSRRLHRPIALGDLIVRGNGYDLDHEPVSDGAGHVAEMVRFLDLEGRAVLTDHYHFQRWPTGSGPVTLPYSSVGRATGSCLSHAGVSQWLEVPNGMVRRSYQMRIAAKEGEALAGGAIQNRIEYADGVGESLLTTVAYPTECLTVLVLFAAGRTCKSVSGAWRPGATDAYQPACAAPLCFPGCKLVCWRIAQPSVGATYQLNWLC